MVEEIKNNLENPRMLETLYRTNKTSFKQAFTTVYPEIQETAIARVWHERLNFSEGEISWGTRKEWGFVLLASLLATLIAKLPVLAGLEEELFYSRNLAFISFPFVIGYFAWKQRIGLYQWLILAATLLIAITYINLLPRAESRESDTLILACIHLPLFIWSVLGFVFVGKQKLGSAKRLEFLRFNGDLAVMSAVFLIAGGLFTAITLGLFSVIDVNIEQFYLDYVAVGGLAALLIVATHLVRTNPELVNKVSPVIAKTFMPIVLVTLVVYLFTVVQVGKDPYKDRDFLLLFNMLLIGVMAIILFSIAEGSKSTSSKLNIVLLLLLSVVTVLVNGIALSAILFRIAEWGITPNRMAVLGANLLMLVNLVIITYHLSKAIKKNEALPKVAQSIATFLPLYAAWTLAVTFLFPVLFGFS